MTGENFMKNGPIVEFNKLKMNEEHDDDAVRAENHLIKLPEAILHHILSFLPIKDAARTSVLSKQWEYIWLSTPNIFFGRDPCNGTSTIFLDFVDRAFILRNCDIKEFTLRIDEIIDQARIRKWISGLVWRNVKKLSIGLNYCNNALEFPHCLFTCASLRHLDLQLSTSYTLKLPTSTCLPNLEVLLLDCITFSDDHSTQMLFTGSPRLKVLSLYRCNWENISSVNICCPQLWWCCINDMDIDGYNIWNESYGCKISILGSSLVFFSYAGQFLNDYCLYDASLLHLMCFEVYFTSERLNIVANRFYKLLNGSYDVQKLALSESSLEVLPFTPKVLVDIPLFKNLRGLELNMGVFNPRHQSIVKILEKCLCLEALEFTEGIEASEGEQVEDFFKPVPSCFSSHLKTIYVGNFDGNKRQCMDLVEVLLERAKSLQNLVLHYNPSSISSDEATDNFIEEILNLPRAAEVLELVYKTNCVKCGKVCHVHGQMKKLEGCWP